MKTNKVKAKVVSNTAGHDLRIAWAQQDIDTGTYSVAIEFPLVSGGRAEVVVPRSDLLLRQRIQSMILDKGGRALSDFAQQLETLTNTLPQPRHVTGRGGWHGDQFVTKYGSFCARGKKPDILFNTQNDEYVGPQQAGSLEEYKRCLKIPLERSSYLTFLLAASLVPALAGRIGMEGGFSVNLSQTSSAGKTLALRVVQSAVSKAEEQDLASINVTTGKSVALLVPFGGLAFGFGDLKAAAAKDKDLLDMIQTFVFSTHGNSQRKTLMTGRPQRANYCVPMLSTERPLAELFAAAGRIFENGEAVRLLDLQVPDPQQGGIFDNAGKKAPRELVKDVEDAIAENYGHLLGRWVRALAKANIKTIRDIVAREETEFLSVLKDTSPVLSRIARYFSLVDIAGRYAAKGGLFPVDAECVREACLKLFHLLARDILDRERPTLLAAQALLDRLNDSDRFEMAKRGTSIASDATAFRRQEADGIRLFVRRPELKAAISDDYLLDRIVLPNMHRLGALQPRETQTVMQKGIKDKHRYYCFNSDILKTITTTDLLAKI